MYYISRNETTNISPSSPPACCCRVLNVDLVLLNYFANAALSAPYSHSRICQYVRACLCVRLLSQFETNSMYTTFPLLQTNAQKNTTIKIVFRRIETMAGALFAIFSVPNIIVYIHFFTYAHSECLVAYYTLVSISICLSAGGVYHRYTVYHTVQSEFAVALSWHI